MAAERSAARLAHQSGGLGVPGSNPGAPTKIIKYFKYFMGLRAFADPGENGTERHRSAYIGAESPGGAPPHRRMVALQHRGDRETIDARPAEIDHPSKDRFSVSRSAPG
jgi:hypothetical protein